MANSLTECAIGRFIKQVVSEQRDDPEPLAFGRHILLDLITCWLHDACALAPSDIEIRMRPEDFAVRYKWIEGSVPPPYHYEYEIHVGPGENGRIIFCPDYPMEAPPVWIEEFHLDNVTLNRLYEFMVEKGVLVRDWTDMEDATVGGELEWMEGIANKIHFKVPSAIEESEMVESIYEFLRSLVPERIWTKLMSQQQQYEIDYLESRE